MLRSKNRPGIAHPERALAKALAAPLGTRALGELARGRKSACVVISDITRPVPNELILSQVLPVLESAGIPRSRITILIGTGTHRVATREEVLTLVGARIAREYRVESHDCRRGNKVIGAVTSPLTGERIPIAIDKRYLEADFRVLTGLVEPHIFCGYSGGRKAILPGIAALSTIRKWHSPEIIAHSHSIPGNVAGNVAHKLINDVARMVGADFTVNVTLNSDREVTGVFAGGFEEVFRAAVARLESYVLTKPTRPAKVVVTSSAGWPLDTTFYQAIKGLVAALPVMAPGGVVILAARCDEGYGDALFSDLIRRTKDVAQWSRRLHGSCRFQLGQWQWQRMGWTRERGRVFLVSELCAADAHTAHTCPYPSLQAAVDAAIAETKADAIVVVPEGPYVVTRGAR
jgi:nickel-dependent lactate racemase